MMGTSSSFGGPSGATPLVPSWLVNDLGDAPTTGVSGVIVPPNVTAPRSPVALRPPIPAAASANRFTAARNNFSRFAGSGGRDRSSLARAVSHYVNTASGGARTASKRMGASRQAGSRLLGFLSDVVTRSVTEALRTLNFSNLADRPIEQIFAGLADYVCPDGGSIDEGIARDAFIETIADLAQNGITDLDRLTAEQMRTVFELYATNAIESRLCNDIGARTVTMPSDSREASAVQAQLHDFIARGVADALTQANLNAEALSPENVLAFVEDVYEQAFEILQLMGDKEGAST